MERLAIFAHGFNVRDKGKRTTDKLVPFFKRRNYFCYEKDTTVRLFLGVRFGTPKYAEEVKTYVNYYKKLSPNTHAVFIGHSDGCNMGNQAAHKGALFDQMVYINPALNNSTPLAPQVNRCIVLHNEDDKAVRLAKYIPFHPWGDMGNVGYTGEDKRYMNWDTKSVYLGHSGMFEDEHITKYYANRILTNLEKNYVK